MVICSRLWVDLIQKAATIVFVEHPREAPWLILKRLHILNLDQQYVTWFGSSDVERSREIVNFGKIYILDVVCAVIVANLPPCSSMRFGLRCID